MSDSLIPLPTPLPKPAGQLPEPSDKEFKGELQDPLQLGIWHHENLRLPASAYFFSISASQGNPLGLILYGLSLRHGWGVKQDPVLGFKCFQLAAKSAVWELEEGIGHGGGIGGAGGAASGAGTGISGTTTTYGSHITTTNPSPTPLTNPALARVGVSPNAHPPLITRQSTTDTALETLIHDTFEPAVSSSMFTSGGKVAAPDFSGAAGAVPAADDSSSTSSLSLEHQSGTSKVLSLLGIHKRRPSSSSSTDSRTPSYAGSLSNLTQPPVQSTPPVAPQTAPLLPTIEAIQNRSSGATATGSQPAGSDFIAPPRRASISAPYVPTQGSAAPAYPVQPVPTPPVDSANPTPIPDVEPPVFVPTPRGSSRLAVLSQPDPTTAAAGSDISADPLSPISPVSPTPAVDSDLTFTYPQPSTTSSSASLPTDQDPGPVRPPRQPTGPVLVDETSGPVMTLSRKRPAGGAGAPSDTTNEASTDEAGEQSAAFTKTGGEQEPVAALKQIASQQLVLAIFEMGQSFAYGWGTPPNPSLALHYYTLASKLGDASAMECLGDACMRGDLGLKRDKYTAAQWYKRAIKAGGMKNVPGMEWVWKEKYEEGAREGQQGKKGFGGFQWKKPEWMGAK
ncbi:hypothetical protein HDU93_000503 [Gonapodya sp. JEL0774]|nr:hypothetical protein HDU93_000503 [Gonapodya sp. JEL0774]